MNNLRTYIRTILEGHYTGWMNIDELGPLQYGEGRGERPVDTFMGQEELIVQKLAKHFNIKKTAPLGSGTNGFAYYIPNNRVLKVTKDKSEVAEANKIQGLKLKHLANVYGTYTLGGKYAGTYVIISELLNKSEDIDDAEEWLSIFFENRDDADVFKRFNPDNLWDLYKAGKISPLQIKTYINEIHEYFEPYKAQLVEWYLKGMFAIVDEIKKHKILSTDWGVQNLGIKKDGNLAMYDLGYGDPDVPKSIDNINLNEKSVEESAAEKLYFSETMDEWWSADEYPEFTDGQFNPIFKNRPSPPTMNMNTTPLSETEISQEELHKKDLPMEHPDMIDDFILSKSEAEIREIAPTINLRQSPVNLVADMKKNYPSLYDNFAEWISQVTK